MESAFVSTIKVLTTIAQIAQRLSPVPDLYRAHKQRDAGVMAFMPLVALLLGNYVWLLYAYVVENIFPLFSVCVFGDIILDIYVAIYAKCCPNRAYVVKTIAMRAIPFLFKKSIWRHIGYLANVTTFALYLSPFEKIKLVIKTESSAAIPVLLCGIIFINSSLWLINGIIDNDLPNVVGVTLTAVQLTLYYIYLPTRHTSSVDTGDSEFTTLDLEMSTTAKVW